MPEIESLLETVADITQAATQLNYRTNDSRQAISNYVEWAREFEATRVEDDDGMALFYNGREYLEAIDAFVQDKTGLPVIAPTPPRAVPTPRPQPRRRQARTIPPDPDGQNIQRAEWADEALETFMDATGTDREDALADLLCALRHWCDRHDTSFARESERALRHYREETTPLTAQDLGVNGEPAPTTREVPFREIPNQPTPSDEEVPF